MVHFELSIASHQLTTVMPVDALRIISMPGPQHFRVVTRCYGIVSFRGFSILLLVVGPLNADLLRLCNARYSCRHGPNAPRRSPA
jgi:hypothetical protein